MLYKYPISLKKTKSADRINPIPILNRIRQAIGYKRNKNLGVIGNPLTTTKTKNIERVKPKLIREDTFLDKRKIYLGTLTLLKIPAFATRELIP